MSEAREWLKENNECGNNATPDMVLDFTRESDPIMGKSCKRPQNIGSCGHTKQRDAIKCHARYDILLIKRTISQQWIQVYAATLMAISSMAP